jgi:hypothetical protein
MESPQTLLEVSPQTLDGPEEPPLDLSPSMLHELQHNMSDIRQAHSPTAIKVRVDHSMAETLLGQVDDLIRLLEVHSTNLWPLTKSYTLPKSLRAYGYMDDAFLDRWACVLSALLREVESEPEVGQVELKDAHYELRGWITRQDLGFIHGLAREHAPKHGSWRGDARHHAKKLRRDLKRSLGYKITERVMDPGTAKRRVGDLLDSYEDSRELSQGLERLLKEGMKADTCVLRLLCPVLDEMQGSNLHGLRKKVRAQNKEDEHEEQREDTQLGVIPGKSWPFWSLTRGRGAVMVGSAGRVHQIASIKEAFGFSDIDVIEAGQGVRRVQALCQRLAQDEDRVVLVMHRYISHKASGMVWGYRDNATIIGVDRGFCVGAVRQAIEKFGPAYLDD